MAIEKNLDDCLEQMEKRNNDEIEIKTNRLTKLEKDLSENIKNMKETHEETKSIRTSMSNMNAYQRDLNKYVEKKIVL